MTPGIEIKAPVEDELAEVLTDDTLAFVLSLHKHFDARRLELLELRKKERARVAAG